MGHSLWSTIRAEILFNCLLTITTFMNVYKKSSMNSLRANLLLTEFQFCFGKDTILHLDDKSSTLFLSELM